MRPTIPRPSATCLFFLVSTVLISDTFAQGLRRLGQADLPPPPAPTQTKPIEAKPTEAKPTEDKPAEAKPTPVIKPTDAKPNGAAKTPGTAATIVNLKTIEGIMGKSVRSRTANEDMGRIVDVLVDGTGQVRAAVIDFGGFLGVGSRKVAVAWKTLDFTDSIQSGSIKVTLTRDQVRQSPEYKPDEPIVILEGASPPKAAGAAPSAKPADVTPPPAGLPPPPGHKEDAPAR